MLDERVESYANILLRRIGGNIMNYGRNVLKIHQSERRRSEERINRVSHPELQLGFSKLKTD